MFTLCKVNVDPCLMLNLFPDEQFLQYILTCQGSVQKSAATHPCKMITLPKLHCDSSALAKFSSK